MTKIEERYISLLGFVPNNIAKRIEIANATNSIETIEIIELYRKQLIHNNCLDDKTQQLVHFALLVGSMQKTLALLHAKGAIKSGASAEELFGVCQTAAVTGGMPAFSLAIECVYDALEK